MYLLLVCFRFGKYLILWHFSPSSWIRSTTYTSLCIILIYIFFIILLIMSDVLNLNFWALLRKLSKWQDASFLNREDFFHPSPAKLPPFKNNIAHQYSSSNSMSIRQLLALIPTFSSSNQAWRCLECDKVAASLPSLVG